MTSFTIYKYGDPLHGEIYVSQQGKKNSLSRNFLKGISSGMIALSIIGIGTLYGPILTQELNYRSGNSSYAEINLAEIAEANDVKAVQNEAAEYGVNSYFSVVIPKIGASENILANIDTSDRQEYETALQNGIAHAKGTHFPGQEENVFLFAHSTNSPLNVARYNATFYLLNKLEDGDKIIVYFADKKYEYKVTGSHVVDPDDTKWLENTDKEQLTLQTCYPPGTTWKRLIVTAEPTDIQG